MPLESGDVTVNSQSEAGHGKVFGTDGLGTISNGRPGKHL